MVFDTGSPLLIVASTLCDESCTKQVKFNSSKSSTFQDFGDQLNREDPIRAETWRVLPRFLLLETRLRRSKSWCKIRHVDDEYK